MDQRIRVLFILAILSLSPTLADNLTCQYRINETQSNETWIFYFEDVPLNITLLEAKELETWSVKNGYWPSDGYHSEYRFKVYNYYTSPINLTLDYIVDGHLSYRNISIDPKGYQTITGEGQNVELNTVNYAITSPEYLTTNRGIISRDLENCKDCLGKTCLNDGEFCNLSQECGSGFCIRGYCSASEDCFNNDCKCASDEIQCTDNKRCMKISSVPIDVKPGCGLYQECVTSYMNATTGLCSKSPTQLQEEEIQREAKLKEEEDKRQAQIKAEDLKRQEDQMKFLMDSMIKIVLLLFLAAVVIIVLKKTKSGRGKRFEEYVLHKFNKNEWVIEDRTKDWGVVLKRLVVSDSNPDLVMRHIVTGKIVAVECKYHSSFEKGKKEFGMNWTSKRKFNEGEEKIKKYVEFRVKTKYPIFVVIGVGGKEEKPEKLYLLPLHMLEKPWANKSHLDRYVVGFREFTVSDFSKYYREFEIASRGDGTKR
jgi:hypothetical protein